MRISSVKPVILLTRALKLYRWDAHDNRIRLFTQPHKELCTNLESWQAHLKKALFSIKFRTYVHFLARPFLRTLLHVARYTSQREMCSEWR